MLISSRHTSVIHNVRYMFSFIERWYDNDMMMIIVKKIYKSISPTLNDDLLFDFEWMISRLAEQASKIYHILELRELSSHPVTYKWRFVNYQMSLASEFYCMKNCIWQNVVQDGTYWRAKAKSPVKLTHYFKVLSFVIIDENKKAIQTVDWMR